MKHPGFIKNLKFFIDFFLGSHKLRHQIKQWQWLFLATVWAVCISLGQASIISTPALPIATPSEITIAQAPPPPATTPKTGTTDLKSFPNSSKPIKVSIGLHVSNLANIDQSTESFDVAGYLMYSWRDPRLAYQSNQGNTQDSSLDQIWHPAIEMVNVKASSISEHTIEILPDGTVLAQERFSKTLSSALELYKFPFDRQSLDVVLESLRYGNKMVELVVDPAKISLGRDKFVSLSEWKNGEIKGINSLSFFPPEKQNYSRTTIEIHIERNPGFYVFKVILPLLLITIASWSVFWINPQEFSTQISIAFTNLLTVVALLLVINDKLPRVGYITFMDGFTMSCFATILIVILELIFTHQLETHNSHQKAQKIHLIARWLVPTAFVLSNVMITVYFLLLQ